jgi:Flp pilus assembly protein TadB
VGCQRKNTGWEKKRNMKKKAGKSKTQKKKNAGKSRGKKRKRKKTQEVGIELETLAFLSYCFTTFMLFLAFFFFSFNVPSLYALREYLVTSLFL